MYQNSGDHGNKPTFKDKMKQKMSELGDKMKNTNFGIGNIKGLVQGYDNIDDSKKSGFHGFESSGIQSNHGLPQGSNFSSGGGGISGGAGGFGSGGPPTASQWSGGGNIGLTKNQSGSAYSQDPFGADTSDSHSPPRSPASRKKKKKTKVVETSSSEESSSDEEDSDSSSESEEARLAREKEERKKARKERKRAAAAAEAAAAEEAEAIAKAERRRLRKAKKDAKEAVETSEAVAKQQRRDARRAKKETKHRDESFIETAQPLFAKGSTVSYKHKDRVTVIGVHSEDPGEPYYTILTSKGREKQTTEAYLSCLEQSSPTSMSPSSTNLLELSTPTCMPPSSTNLLEPSTPTSMSPSGSCCERTFCKSEDGMTTPSAHGCLDPTSHCNDQLSLKETLKSIRDSLGQEWVTTMYQRFAESTGANGNEMDLEAFGKFLEPFGVPLSKWGAYFHGFDRAGNGVIDLREFLLGMAFLGESSLSLNSPQDLEEKSATLFRIYDQNKDGTLNFEELSEMLSHLHTAAEDEFEQDDISAEAREVAEEILQVLPTGTLTHGITLNTFVKAVESKDIFKSTTALLKQGIAPVEERNMAQVAEDFAGVFVNSQPSTPKGSEEPCDESPGGSKMDLSAFFSPPSDDSESSDEE